MASQTIAAPVDQPYRGSGIDRPRGVPLPPERLSLFRAGQLRKRWHYLSFWSRELSFCAAHASVGPLPQAYWGVWDRAAQQFRQGKHLTTSCVQFGPGHVYVHDGDVEIDVAFDECGSFEVYRPEDRAYIWSHKDFCLEARGTVRYGNTTRTVAGVMFVDINEGYHTRHTQWHWSAGAGLDQHNRLVAFNAITGLFDTPTNSERTIGYSPKLFDPPGAALPDWQIVARLAQRLGYQGFQYASAAEVWDEFIALTSGRPCDMAGATSARLRATGSLQWPCPTPDHPGSKRRYLDGCFATPTRRARFLPRHHRQPCELPDHEFPFVLTTGRLYAHWHTLTRTAKAEKLVRRAPHAFAEINPLDAAALHLQEGDLVQLSSRRGTIQLPARLSHQVMRGMVFIPFHWGDLFGEGNAANYLTISAIGRVAKQPELKFCAVNLEKVNTSGKALAALSGER